MTCREFADFIIDYQSGELSAEARDEFMRHLALCENCRNYLAAYQNTVRLGQRAFDDERAELPAEVPEDLVNAILAARAAGKR